MITNVDTIVVDVAIACASLVFGVPPDAVVAVVTILILSVGGGGASVVDVRRRRNICDVTAFGTIVEKDMPTPGVPSVEASIHHACSEVDSR